MGENYLTFGCLSCFLPFFHSLPLCIYLKSFNLILFIFLLLFFASFQLFNHLLLSIPHSIQIPSCLLLPFLSSFPYFPSLHRLPRCLPFLLYWPGSWPPAFVLVCVSSRVRADFPEQRAPARLAAPGRRRRREQQRHACHRRRSGFFRASVSRHQLPSFHLRIGFWQHERWGEQRRWKFVSELQKYIYRDNEDFASPCLLCTLESAIIFF